MQRLRAVHRIVMLLVGFVILYLCTTGSFLQLIDIRTIISNPPATDPEWIALREYIFGAQNYIVINPVDYTAAAFPSQTEFGAMLARALPTAHQAAAGKPLDYVELRMVNGQPEVVADAKGSLIHVDATTGALLSTTVRPRLGREPEASIANKSLRTKWKGIHNLSYLRGYGSPIMDITGIGLMVLVVTGLMMFLKLFQPRLKSARANPFWKGGSWWRSLHRSISIVAVLILTVEILSGSFLAFEGSYVRMKNMILASKHIRHPFGGTVDASSPLKDEELPSMLNATLAAESSAQPGAHIKVVRLRYFGGMAQGIIVAGDGNNTGQWVFNTATGRTVTETEPGYPNMDLPLGWQAHMWAKLIHRGDWFAIPGTMLPGRLISLFAGLSMLYLTISGIPMYMEHWKRRREAKAKQKMQAVMAD